MKSPAVSCPNYGGLGRRNGNPRGVCSALGTRHPPCHPLAAPFGDFGTCTFPSTPRRFARALALGLAKPSRDASLPARARAKPEEVAGWVGRSRRLAGSARAARAAEFDKRPPCS